MPDVVAVVVTYGDRFSRICRPTLESVLRDGATRILVVDNGSTDESAAGLQAFAEQFPQVTVLRNDVNVGSAAAFADALAWAQQSSSEFVWLLDDDNTVVSGTLTKLLAAHADEESGVGAGEEVVVGPRRVPNSLHERIANGAPVNVVYPRAGAFLGFDGGLVLRQRLARLGRRTATPAPTSVRIPYAPYGGLLFRRSVLDSAEPPMRQLQLYADDTVWTSRLVDSGVGLFLRLDIVVEDSEGKWTQAERGNSLINALRSSRHERLYLSTRNRVWFDRQRVKGAGASLRYWLNRAIIMIIARIGSWRTGSSDGMRVMRDAVRDAERGDLSRTYSL